MAFILLCVVERCRPPRSVVVSFTAIYLRTNAQKKYENFWSHGIERAEAKKNMLQIWISHHFMWFFPLTFVPHSNNTANVVVPYKRTFYAVPIARQAMKRPLRKSKTVIYSRMVFSAELLSVRALCYRSEVERQRWIHIFRPFRLCSGTI